MSENTTTGAGLEERLRDCLLPDGKFDGERICDFLDTDDSLVVTTEEATMSGDVFDHILFALARLTERNRALEMLLDTIDEHRDHSATDRCLAVIVAVADEIRDSRALNAEVTP